MGWAPLAMLDDAGCWTLDVAQIHGPRRWPLRASIIRSRHQKGDAHVQSPGRKYLSGAASARQDASTITRERDCRLIAVQRYATASVTWPCRMLLLCPLVDDTSVAAESILQLLAPIPPNPNWRLNGMLVVDPPARLAPRGIPAMAGHGHAGPWLRPPSTDFG